MKTVQYSLRAVVLAAPPCTVAQLEPGTPPERKEQEREREKIIVPCHDRFSVTMAIGALTLSVYQDLSLPSKADPLKDLPGLSSG